MNKRMRIFLTICGIVVGTGLILSIVGAALGGIGSLSRVEDRVPWISLTYGQGEKQMIAAERFSSIDIEADLGQVELIEGQKFAVEMTYEKREGAPKVSVENGTLNIRPADHRWRWLNLNIFRTGDYKGTAVKIYYPKGTVFGRVKVESDIGDVKISDLSAETLEVGSDAGDVTIERVTAGGMNLRADIGDLKGNEIRSSSANIELNTGAMILSGAFAGTTKIDCDTGDCTLNTSLPQNTYAIKTEANMGDCSINGQSVGGTYVVENPAAANRIETQCNLGDTKINFQ